MQVEIVRIYNCELRNDLICHPRPCVQERGHPRHPIPVGCRIDRGSKTMTYPLDSLPARLPAGRQAGRLHSPRWRSGRE